ncbi:hypothetical protein ACFLZJ_01925 [Nanoarchaeota archaeon]
MKKISKKHSLLTLILVNAVVTLMIVVVAILILKGSFTNSETSQNPLLGNIIAENQYIGTPGSTDPENPNIPTNQETFQNNEEALKLEACNYFIKHLEDQGNVIRKSQDCKDADIWKSGDLYVVEIYVELEGNPSSRSQRALANDYTVEMRQDKDGDWKILKISATGRTID